MELFVYVCPRSPITSMTTTKEKLRIAYEAGRNQKQLEGTKWYPSAEQSITTFEAWYKQFKKRK